MAIKKVFNWALYNLLAYVITKIFELWPLKVL
jgi:hypothetical protein